MEKKRMYKVESDFNYKGYRCVVIFGDFGTRCGYVGVTKDSKFYGKSFDSTTDVRLKDLHEPLGKRSILTLFGAPESEEGFVRMDLLFDVHGGLTYGEGYCDYPVESEGIWWLGFDCAHAGDGKDLDLLEELWGDEDIVKRRLKVEREVNAKYPTVSDGPVRSKEYCEDECRSLVEQIIKWEGK